MLCGLDMVAYAGAGSLLEAWFCDFLLEVVDGFECFLYIFFYSHPLHFWTASVSLCWTGLYLHNLFLSSYCLLVSVFPELYSAMLSWIGYFMILYILFSYPAMLDCCLTKLAFDLCIFFLSACCTVYLCCWTAIELSLTLPALSLFTFSLQYSWRFLYDCYLYCSEGALWEMMN